MENPVTIVVPPSSAASLYDVSLVARFGGEIGRSLARLYDKMGVWEPSNEPLAIIIGGFIGKFDCHHSQYAAALPLGVAGLSKLLDVSGLYRLAAYLKENPCGALKGFEGTISAFGSPLLRKRPVLNRDSGTAGDLPDLATPVLYLRDGAPMSIYWVWHTESVGDEGSTNYYAIQGPEWALCPNETTPDGITES